MQHFEFLYPILLFPKYKPQHSNFTKKKLSKSLVSLNCSSFSKITKRKKKCWKLCIFTIFVKFGKNVHNLDQTRMLRGGGSGLSPYPKQVKTRIFRRESAKMETEPNWKFNCQKLSFKPLETCGGKEKFNIQITRKLKRL